MTFDIFCPSYIPEGGRSLLAMRLCAENCAPLTSTLELRCEQDVEFDGVAVLTAPEEKRSDTVSIVQMAKGCMLQLGAMPSGLRSCPRWVHPSMLHQSDEAEPG